MTGYHAKIAPSELERTVACNGWIQLAEGLPPEPPGEESLEGSAADWVAKQYATGNEVPYGSPTPIPGYPVDWDMIHGAKIWAEVVGYGAISGVPVVIQAIHPTDCWGEPDGWRWDPIERVLRMRDYKYGFEIHDPFEHWQMMAYARGVIDTLQLVDFEIEVELTIVQPRAYHKDGPVRSWRIRGDELRPYINQAMAAAHAAVPPSYGDRGPIPAPPPQTKTGPHCTHCPARLHCRTFQTVVSQAVQFAANAERIPVTAEAVGVQLLIAETMAELLEAQLTALRAQAESFLRGGQRVPNYHMEPGQSRREWNEGITAEEIIGLGAVFQKDLRKPPALPNSRSSQVITPTQAIKAGVDEAVISQYASRPTGAMKLARTSITEARKVFGANKA